MLVVGQREALEGEDHALRPVTTHTHRLVVGTQGLQHAFLDSRSFDHFLVDDFEGDHVDRVRQVGLVFHREVEVEEVVVDVQPAKQELKAKLPRADMADRAAVTLLDRFHQQLDKHGRFAAQFLEIDVGAVGR